MRFLDLRLTLCNANIFLRLFCQYPGVFYYLMASATLPRRTLFSWEIKKATRQPIYIQDLFKRYIPTSGE